MNNKRWISILGSPASGKTTLSKALSESLGMKHVRMSDLKIDKHKNYCDSTWEEYLTDNFIEYNCIFDGYLKESINARLKLSDVIIIVETPFLACLINSYKRSFLNLIKESDLVHYTYNKNIITKILYSLNFRKVYRIIKYHLYRKYILYKQLDYKKTIFIQKTESFCVIEKKIIDITEDK